MTGPIRRVDHVYVEFTDPEAVFDALTGPLGLPVAWPYAEYGGAFASGGVYIGDLIMETVTFGRTTDLGAAVALSAYPSLAEARVELDGRGVTVGPDEPFTAGDTLLWTNAKLPTLSGSGFDAFICEYAMDARQWWDRCAKELAASDGGAAGVRAVEEIVIDVADLETSAVAWSLVLPFAEGPSVRLTPGSADGLSGLRIRVGDPARAEAAFAEHVPVPLPLTFVG